MEKVKLISPAKINLTLEVIRKLPSGFHELRSIMMKISGIHDEIEVIFDENKEGIKIFCFDKNVPKNQNNICMKIAEEFFKETRKKIGLTINIKKNIPIAAGLGGGSSNGAAVLMALNKYFKEPLSEKKLIKIAAEVGKDIPFFLEKYKMAYVSGMGEKIKKLKCDCRLNLLVINPGFYISTAQSFSELDKEFKAMNDKGRKNISGEFIKHLKSGNPDLISGKIYNDFEISMQKNYPILKELKQELIVFGALNSSMSGSGPTIFGIFKDRKGVFKARKILKKYHPDFFIEPG